MCLGKGIQPAHVVSFGNITEKDLKTLIGLSVTSKDRRSASYIRMQCLATLSIRLPWPCVVSMLDLPIIMAAEPV